MLIQQEVKAMRALGRGGAIVNSSSVASTGGNAGLSLYGASKGAIDTMIRHVAIEVGGDGIRINSVSPAFLRTPMTAGMPEEIFANVAAPPPLKRLPEAEEIGDIAVWLCTDEARFLTGQNIMADGGYNIAGRR